MSTLPTGGDWQYEPKWDGFRCLVFRDGDAIELMSKAGKPLGRYFPELVAGLKRLRARKFVLDGEIVVPDGKALSFDTLLLRIHPARSRVEMLAREHPAAFIVFDLLVDARGRRLDAKPLAERRAALESFMAANVGERDPVLLSPATTKIAAARAWLRRLGEGLDGIVAKRLDLPYQSGARTGMLKVKSMRTADCVVGGFRYGSRERLVGSLLLGLYDDAGVLHHVGFTSNLPHEEKPAITRRLESIASPPGFTGRAPGGPSRWSTERSAQWVPVRPKLVVEVRYDHFAGGRFRHGTSFRRWRPDKDPRQCTLAQVERESRSALALVPRGRRGAAKRAAKRAVASRRSPSARTAHRPR